MESLYLERFTRLREKAGNGKIFGDKMLVEVIEDGTETKTKGGIIIAESSHARSEFTMLKSLLAIVLEVGQGYYDSDTGKDIPLNSKPGHVIWVDPYSVGYCTTVPGIQEVIPDKRLALVSESQVRKSWPSLEAYLADQAALNEVSDSEVGGRK